MKRCWRGSRRRSPDVAVSSDFIVGFCGEDEASFERTVGLVERSRFKNSFIFKYSERKGTKADRAVSPTTFPRTSRSGGTTTCLRCRTPISLEDNRRWIGKTVEVLVEGTESKDGPARWLGWRFAVDGADLLRSDHGVRRGRTTDWPARPDRG